MALPLRKDKPEEELTTADFARKPRAEDEHAGGPLAAGRPVASERDAARAGAGQVSSEDESAPLFPSNELEDLRNRWNQIQTGFVDEPRRAVEQADNLVASAMKRLAEVFAEERSKLEEQWDRGDDVSTEDLRLALQRYRSFFHRLLSV
jgi:hypothetical protein